MGWNFGGGEAAAALLITGQPVPLMGTGQPVERSQLLWIWLERECPARSYRRRVSWEKRSGGSNCLLPEGDRAEGFTSRA